MVGWNLRKFLQLARKSNPSAMEWLASPIVYAKAPTPAASWRSPRPASTPRAASTTNTRWQQATIAALMSIRQSQGQALPLHSPRAAFGPVGGGVWHAGHMTFSALTDALLSDELRPAVVQLLDHNMHVPESLLVPRVAEVDAWIEDQLDELLQAAE